MERYNPHSIEKQATNWPVFAYETDIFSDIRLRVKSLDLESGLDWFFPAYGKEFFDEEITKEYGVDASRMAVFGAAGDVDPNVLLESSYNWISRFFDFYQKHSDSFFDEEPWFRALYQMPDHILKRKKNRSALAFLQKAFKISKPSKNMSCQQKELVLTAIYPFIPLLSVFLAKREGLKIGKIVDILNLSKRFTGVRFRIGEGGWHSDIFDKNLFSDDPIREFLKIKWVGMAASGKKIELREIEGGKQIVFFG